MAKIKAEEEEAKRLRDEINQVLAGSTIEFKYNSSILQPKSIPILNRLVAIFKEHPDINFEIQGHTDKRGKEDYNVKLSQQRADAVKQYLIKEGLDENRFTTRGYGSSMPIADNSTNEGRLKNRRVVFQIIEEE